MLKISILSGLSILALLAATAFSEHCVAMAISAPIVIQSNVETSSASNSAQSAIMLERGGMDRASVHLQILQQTTTHFAESNVTKKSVNDEKKMQSKPASNS